jgi:AcrR family transcriptional regulator
MDQPPLPLRERNRRRARDEIRAVALRLFLERGYAQTTVQQVAEAAGISPATFFRYFPSKGDVVFYRQDEAVQALRDALAAAPRAPAMEQVRDVLLRFQLQERSTVPQEQVVARLIAGDEQLQAHAARFAAALQAVVAGHLADRGMAPARAQVVAGALFGALQAARRVVGESADADVRHLLNEAFDLVAAAATDRE